MLLLRSWGIVVEGSSHVTMAFVNANNFKNRIGVTKDDDVSVERKAADIRAEFRPLTFHLTR